MALAGVPTPGSLHSARATVLCQSYCTTCATAPVVCGEAVPTSESLYRPDGYAGPAPLSTKAGSIWTARQHRRRDHSQPCPNALSEGCRGACPSALPFDFRDVRGQVRGPINQLFKRPCFQGMPETRPAKRMGCRDPRPLQKVQLQTRHTCNYKKCGTQTGHALISGRCRSLEPGQGTAHDRL